MPVHRCPECHRGLAGYLDSEKVLREMPLEEVRTEIPKYEAKGRRIEAHREALRTGTPPQDFQDGVACPGCHQGWREFQNHRKDLEQLTMSQATAALAVNTRYLDELLDRLHFLAP